MEKENEKGICALIKLFSLQALLVTIVLLAAFGNDGLRLTFGVEDFLGVGTSLGLAMVVPLILIAYVFGASLFVMVSASSNRRTDGQMVEMAKRQRP